MSCFFGCEVGIYVVFFLPTGSPHFSHALEKLINASVSSIPSPFLSSVVYSASQRLEFGIRGDGSLSDKKLEGILKVSLILAKLFGRGVYLVGECIW